MAETVTKLPIKQDKPSAASSLPQMWQPPEGLRQKVDRLFDDFGRGFWRPFGRSLFAAEPLFRRKTTSDRTPGPRMRGDAASVGPMSCPIGMRQRQSPYTDGGLNDGHTRVSCCRLTLCLCSDTRRLQLWIGHADIRHTPRQNGSILQVQNNSF